MKVGETLEVTIGGMKVADAKIVDVNHKDSTVELVIPGRRVVMGFKTQLDVPPPVEQTTTHAILGVEQRETPEVSAVEAPSVEAPAVEAPDTSKQEDAPVVESVEAPETVETNE